jgi:Contractile injection system tube protein/LysM domain
MALEKLEIRIEGKSEAEKIVALFNPNLITISKTVNWHVAPTTGRDAPDMQFTHGDPAILNVDLFFDTYEAGTAVTDATAPIYDLTTVETHGDIHRPPICTLSWGNFRTFFEGVMQSLTQRFTLFLEDGTPVRATLTCVFKQWRSKVEEAQAQNLQSADVAKTHTVLRGETLSSIAAAEYNDPALWRPIANANRIEDPRALAPGTVLAIPALASGRGARS